MFDNIWCQAEQGAKVSVINIAVAIPYIFQCFTSLISVSNFEVGAFYRGNYTDNKIGVLGQWKSVLWIVLIISSRGQFWKGKQNKIVKTFLKKTAMEPSL